MRKAGRLAFAAAMVGMVWLLLSGLLDEPIF